MSGPGIFANRDFLLLWSGNATSLVGSYGVRIAYPLLALSITGSPALAGWVGFAITVPSLILQIPAGIAADCWDRRRIMLVCQLAGLTATALAASVVVLGLPNPGLILVVTAFVEGSAYVFFSLSELGAVRDIVAADQRPTAFSFLEAEQPIGVVIGRAVGAAGYGVARWLPFAANAVSYVCCLATLSAIRGNFAARGGAEHRTVRGSWSLAAAGARVVWTEPFLRASTLISGMSNMVIQIVILLLIVEIEHAGRPVWTVGVVLGAAGVGGILGSFAASWLTGRFTAQRVYRGSLWAWAALLLPMALTSNPVVLGVCWFGVGAVGTVVNVALTIFRVNTVPEDTLGRAVGTVALVTDGAVALGALLAGYVLSVLGTAVTAWLLPVAMLLLAVGATYTGRSTRLPFGASLPVEERRTETSR
ncbi:MFS transporter [Nocardia amamiensis]|uniref:MFS transporter n=1 Tax=Nocardia amamiensis TaxID=404578 RepID=UPI0008375F5A|nr:MFS transporter [Nocardia amamiensis]